MELDRRLFNGKLQSSVVYPEFFPLSVTDLVVNLGCGVGPQVVAYKGKFAQMVCVDISQERLEQMRFFLKEHDVQNVLIRCTKVEDTSLSSDMFDRAICIDIIEHLSDPASFLSEVHRILKPGGRALVTIPVMHDVWVQWMRRVKLFFTRVPTIELPQGHPDRHNSDFPLKVWLRLFRNSPLTLVRIRATTLFPPLHLYGIPRFWFRVRWIHSIDRFFSGIPGLRRLGQSWMCILEKQ